MNNFNLEDLAKRYQVILTTSVDELKRVPDFIEKRFPELTGKDKRVKIAQLQELIIAEKDNKINSLKTINDKTSFDIHHGDLIDETVDIFIDVKISSEYTWSAISKDSIDNFNRWENPNYFYLTIGLESRSAVFIQHAYLKQLINENKITYVYTTSGIFIGINAISKLINGSLYDPTKIIEFKF